MIDHHAVPLEFDEAVSEEGCGEDEAQPHHPAHQPTDHLHIKSLLVIMLIESPSRMRGVDESFLLCILLISKTLLRVDKEVTYLTLLLSESPSMVACLDSGVSAYLLRVTVCIDVSELV